MIREQIEVYRQGQSVFIDRVWVRNDGEAVRSDRMYAGHIDLWEEAMRFAHDIATRERLRWGFWRPRFSDATVEFIDLTRQDGWRMWAVKPPMNTATEYARV